MATKHTAPVFSSTTAIAPFEVIAKNISARTMIKGEPVIKPRVLVGSEGNTITVGGVGTSLDYRGSVFGVVRGTNIEPGGTGTVVYYGHASFLVRGTVASGDLLRASDAASRIGFCERSTTLGEGAFAISDGVNSAGTSGRVPGYIMWGRI
jgi:hypothetical protein